MGTTGTNSKSGFCILALTLLSSCFYNVRDIIPQFKTSQEQLMWEVNAIVPIKQLSVKTSKNESLDERTSRNIDIVLTDAQVQSYSQVRLDSLARRMARIAKKEIINIHNFDWVNIIYTRDDGSPASDSTDQQAFVYRPAEL